MGHVFTGSRWYLTSLTITQGKLAAVPRRTRVWLLVTCCHPQALTAALRLTASPACTTDGEVSPLSGSSPLGPFSPGPGV